MKSKMIKGKLVNTEVKLDRFRFDHAYGSVYEWSEQANSYVFIGKLHNRTETAFLRDYFDSEYLKSLNDDFEEDEE